MLFNSKKPENVKIVLTLQEAKVLHLAIQHWIIQSGKILLKEKTVGWLDSMLYSREIYTSAKDKLEKVL